MTDPKIFLAVPSGRSLVSAQTLSSMVAATKTLIENGVAGGFGTLTYPDISEIRNIFLTIWYDAVKSSHLMFIDDDMGFNPQLLLDMLAFDKPLVGALCPKRTLPIEFAGRAKVGDARIKNGFMEVDGIGGALMMIRRDCIDKMLEKFPELSDTVTIKNHAARSMLEPYGITRIIRAFDHLWIDGEKFSEDLSFCLRWKECGGELWANIAYEIIHVGQHEFKGCFLESIKDQIRPLAQTPQISPELEASFQNYPFDKRDNSASFVQAAE